MSAKAKVRFKRLPALMLTLLILLNVFFCELSIDKVLAAKADGEGYTIITTAAELDTILRSNLSGKYRLGNDINLSEYTYNSSTWTSSKGWKGIGETQAKAFKGIFDGNGYKISGLWSLERGSNQGLFGWLSGATIKNLTIELSDRGITGSGERKGGLAGNAYTGTIIENVHVAGLPGSVIKGSGNYIAGLVGVLYQSRISSSSAANISALGTSYVGGLIGYSYESSKVSWSHADNVAVSTKASYVGGFIGGSKQSAIDRCYVMGVDVSASASYAGGFAGVVYQKSDLTSCYAFDAKVKAAYYAGGLVGTVYDYSTIQKSCSYGKVQTITGYIAGGFAGEATNATISNCYAQADVTSRTSGAGGFIAYAAGSTSVNNCYSAGTVSAGSTANVGAFTGHSNITFMGTNYYDSELTGPINAYGTGGTQKGSRSAYPQGKDTATMKKQATFAGWDFVSIWRIDENETYPYFWDWGWWIKEVTVTYDKNAEDATGEMAPQAIPKDTATALNGNQYMRDDYIFLGWSTTSDGEIAYEDAALITLSEDTTLYAIWGRPDLYYSIKPDRDIADVGDTINYTITLGNLDTPNSTTWYRPILYIYLSEHVEFLQDSVVVKKNAGEAQADYTYDQDEHMIIVNLDDITPGEEYIVELGTVALASGEGDDIDLDIRAIGDVIPQITRSANGNSVGIEATGAEVEIIGVEQQ